MERLRRIDTEVDRLFDDLLEQTERMEKRLNEIEEEVGGFGRRSDRENSHDPGRNAD